MTKIISLISSLLATVYTIWYMSFAVPYKNAGALSKIGLSHPVLFCIWGLLTLFALSFNIISAYLKYTKTKAFIPLLSVSALGMLLTLAFDFDFDKRVQYYLHCTGSLLFSVTMGLTIFLLFALCYKRNVLFRAFTYITAFILIGDLICLIIYKETGLIETVPVFAGYIMLLITNLRRDKIATYR